MDNIVPENLVQCAFDFNALTNQPTNNDILLTSASHQKQKYCPNCEQYFPATLDFFHTRKASRDGLNRLCKTCNSKVSVAHKAKKRKERPPKPPKTHCKYGHPLVEGNLRLHGGRYECLTCHREQEIKRNRKKGVSERTISDHCPQGHPLVEGNLKKSGKRKEKHCLICHRESAKRRYHKDPQRMVAEATAYAKSNRDKINERMKEYRQKDIPRLRARASSMRRRAKKFEHTKIYENPRLYEDEESQIYLAMLLKDPCSYCGKPMEHIDHIVPLTKGGSEHWTNLTAACNRCNSRKNNKSLLQFYLYRLEHGS